MVTNCQQLECLSVKTAVQDYSEDLWIVELGKDGAIDSARLRELLTEVDLEYLIEREGGIDSIVDWGAQLSLGEQQRLGMARLFYHTPKFAILDECTSGVTVSPFCPPQLRQRALTSCIVFCGSACKGPRIRQAQQA